MDSLWQGSQETSIPTQGLESCHENGNLKLDRLDITKRYLITQLKFRLYRVLAVGLWASYLTL